MRSAKPAGERSESVVPPGDGLKPPPQPQIETDELLRRLRTVQAELEGAKALYAEADALVLALTDRGFSGAVLTDGTVASLRDNFWDEKTQRPRNVAWRASAQRRFEIDFSDALSAKRKAKP